MKRFGYLAVLMLLSSSAHADRFVSHPAAARCGDTCFGTMDLQGPNSIPVEACALDVAGIFITNRSCCAQMRMAA